MGSSTKKFKEREVSSRKRRHQSPAEERHEQHRDSRDVRGDTTTSREVRGDTATSRDKRHKHKKHHHRERKRERRDQEHASSDSDVVEVVSEQQQQQHHHQQTSSRKQTPPPQPAEESSNTRSHDSLSVHETNKLRAKLGLKPLAVEGASSSSSHGKDDGKKKDDLGEFYHKPAGNITKEKQAEKIKNKLQEHKAKRHIEAKLAKVKPLGASDSEDDAVAWVSKSRNQQTAKQAADQRARALEELDEQFGIGEVIEQQRKQSDQKRAQQRYNERHLKGLRVEHDVDTFTAGRQTILTLKDQEVLAEGEDVLVNVNMVDDERYKKNNENRKRKTPYHFSDDELDEFGHPIEKTLLSKYDEEIDGEKRNSFAIGEDYDGQFDTTTYRRTPSTNTVGTKKLTGLESIREKLAATKRLESLQTGDLRIASEYYSEQELAQFKKPKVRKVRKIRSKGKGMADELERQSTSASGRGIEDVGTRRPKKEESGLDYDDMPSVNIKPADLKLDDTDDNTLERALHKARRLRQRENIISNHLDLNLIKPDPEEEEDETDVSTQSHYTASTSDLQNTGNNPAGGNSIVLNATAEFCRTLGDIPTYGRAGNREQGENEELMMDGEEADKYIVGEKKDGEEDEQDDDLQIMETDAKGMSHWSNVEQGGVGNGVAGGSGVGRKGADNESKGEVPILDEEPDVGSGVGAALRLAMSKGYLDKDESNRPSNTRFAHLQAKHYSIEDKTKGTGGDNETERGGGNRRERYMGPVQDFKEKETFKPNVKLEYIDDDGHILNSKEAFRYLSHKFHGKGPGKNKVEKRIKKSQQEGLMKKMSSTDTPLGTLNMLQAKQKEMQSAYIVLSGGKHTHSTTISKARRN